MLQQSSDRGSATTRPEALTPLIVVSYRDPFFELTDDLTPPLLLTVVGYEIHRWEGYITIASEKTSDGQYRALTHIPSEIVVAKDYVRPKLLHDLIPQTKGTH